MPMSQSRVDSPEHPQHCRQHQDLSDRPRSLRCVLTHPWRVLSTSTAVQVAGLLLNAKIEIDAVAFLPVDPAAA